MGSAHEDKGAGMMHCIQVCCQGEEQWSQLISGGGGAGCHTVVSSTLFITCTSLSHLAQHSTHLAQHAAQLTQHTTHFAQHTTHLAQCIAYLAQHAARLAQPLTGA